MHVETVVLLGRKKEQQNLEYVYIDYDTPENLEFSGYATCNDIIAWIQENYGFHVTRLYIAQIKDKLGIEKERDDTNLRKEGQRVPNCPKEKEEAIIEAFKHFRMI